MTAYLEDNETGYLAKQESRSEQGLSIAPEPINIYRAQIEAFSQALLEGKPNPVNAEIGLRNQNVIAACYESTKTGKAVEL